MRLNTIAPADGAKKKGVRVGRGHGSGIGKTAGRGHKGQKARAGGYHKVGFEGGQMPLQRRLPKFGFTSRLSLVSAEVRLHELNQVSESIDIIDLEALKLSGLVRFDKTRVKIMLNGTIDRAVTIKGLSVTKGAREAILAAGGKVEE